MEKERERTLNRGHDGVGEYGMKRLLALTDHVSMSDSISTQNSCEENKRGIREREEGREKKEGEDKERDEGGREAHGPAKRWMAISAMPRFLAIIHACCGAAPPKHANTCDDADSPSGETMRQDVRSHSAQRKCCPDFMGEHSLMR